MKFSSPNFALILKIDGLFYSSGILQSNTLKRLPDHLNSSRILKYSLIMFC